VRILHSLQQQT